MKEYITKQKPKTIKAWTDYPILRMGDHYGKLAPVRHCTIISYDRDKYCVIRVGRYHESVNRGYIYKREGRFDKVPCFAYSTLCKLPR